MTLLNKMYSALVSKFDDYIILTGSTAIKKYCEYFNIENDLIPNDFDFLLVSSNNEINESTIYEYKRKQNTPERSLTFYHNNNFFDISIIKKCSYCVFNDKDGNYNIIDPFTLLSFYYENQRDIDDYKIELLLKIIDINSKKDTLNIMTKAVIKRKSILDENVIYVQKNIFNVSNSPLKNTNNMYDSPLKNTNNMYDSPLKNTNNIYDSPLKNTNNMYDSPLKRKNTYLSNIENSPPVNNSLSNIKKSLF
jgi:hypothetical protein